VRAAVFQLQMHNVRTMMARGQVVQKALANAPRQQARKEADPADVAELRSLLMRFYEKVKTSTHITHSAREREGEGERCSTHPGKHTRRQAHTPRFVGRLPHASSRDGEE